MGGVQRCDVYVASVSQVDLAARMAITGELWRAGVRADLQYDDERSLDEVAAECHEQNTLSACRSFHWNQLISDQVSGHPSRQPSNAESPLDSQAH